LGYSVSYLLSTRFGAETLAAAVPPALPDAAEENPDHAVEVLQRRALASSAEHLELVAEGNVRECEAVLGSDVG
jgi:hypothetical protein